MADARSRRDGLPHERVDALHGVPGDQRADLRAVRGCPDGECLDRRTEPGGELIDDAGVDVEAVRRGAGLTAVAELGDHGARRRRRPGLRPR